jgi:hypothetical protein
LIKKDLKSLPIEVITSDSKIPWFPVKLLSAESSVDENSSDNLNETAEGQQNDQHNEESESHSGSDEKSDLYFETEGLRVFCRAEERNKQAHQQLRAEELARPRNVSQSSNTPPNQRRNFLLSQEDLNRLKPSWEYVTDYQPPTEIC